MLINTTVAILLIMVWSSAWSQTYTLNQVSNCLKDLLSTNLIPSAPYNKCTHSLEKEIRCPDLKGTSSWSGETNCSVLLSIQNTDINKSGVTFTCHSTPPSSGQTMTLSSKLKCVYQSGPSSTFTLFAESILKNSCFKDCSEHVSTDVTNANPGKVTKQ